MAELFGSFLDFRSPTPNCKIPLILPSNYYHSSPFQSHNSRISRIKRRPPHLTLLSKPSSEFDIISTHEHSDGSLLFRFGDPSEVAKNVKIEESKSVKEEMQAESKDVSKVLMVVEGNSETEARAKKGGREVTGSSSTAVADHTNSIASSSKAVSAVEGESESCERLLEGSDDTESPVLTSTEEMEGTSTVDIDIEHVENVDKGLNEEYEDSNPVESSVIDEGSKVESNVATVKFSETADASSKCKEMEVSSTPAVDIDQTGNVEEGLNEEYEDSPVDASILDFEVKSPPTEAPMTVPSRLEDDSMLEQKTGIGTMEESRKDDGSEHLKEDGDLVEASVNEATVTESTPMSQEMLMTNFILSSGAALLPHPSKVLTGGEDAYFIAGQTWLGVADGVGQWSLEGTSPGVFAQELIKNFERLVSDDNADPINNPGELLNLSVAETQSPGSATVLIAQFDSQALRVANVGDSGFIVLRHGAVYKRSSPMHHVFHFPMQIQRGDDPSSLAEFYRFDLEEDDVIITATDGLLDNLYDQEISSIVMKSLAADKKLEEIAELLAMKAQEIGSSASVRTPFADEAQAAGFAGCAGGRLDDVAVIVSVVQRR